MWDLLRYSTLSVEVGVGLSPKSEVGGIMSFGRPQREIFESFSVTRIGGLYNYFVFGDRLTGIGLHGSIRYVYGQGQGTASDTDQALSAKSHALHAEASVILRSTMDNGPQIEARLGLRWLSSFATASLDGQTQDSQLHTLMLPITVHVGWSF
tara:strand:- start:338 stop:796 length:459 start_codon:yes stop_codon:yes gene_type:complete